MSQDNIKGADDRQLDPKFEDIVFPEELKALKDRSSASTRSPVDPGGLPDFAANLNPDEEKSPFFQHTLSLLENEVKMICGRHGPRKNLENVTGD